MSPPPGPLEDAVGRVGDRWSILVVNALVPGPMRFNDLAERVGGIAPTVLTQRLRHLEQAGVVVPVAYSRKPPRFVYQLSAAGQELAGVVRLLAQWGATLPGPGHPPAGAGTDAEADHLVHVACGTALEPRWYCPTCARVVGEEPPGDELDFV